MAPSNNKNVTRVLHVDDELCLLEISKQILTMENNFEIDNAISVAEALKKMDEQQYDAIVSDYEMPQKNGLEFLKELREQNNQIPFILFTGRGREDVAVKALNFGADSYINKNGSPETVYCELADAINKTVERKKSRELLAKSESKYHALVENSLQGIAILQAAPIRIVFANSALGKILGYSTQELTSLSPEKIMSLVYREERAVFFKRMENRLRGEPAEVCFEFRAVRKDGSIIWLSSLANRVDYDGQPAVQGMFLDVNENKKAGEILRESEQRYRELANCLPDIVFETDLKGQLIFANERAPEISGYSQRELEKGLNIIQFLSPQDREKATKNIRRLLSGGTYSPAEYTFVRKNGTTFPALITATPCISKNKVIGLRGMVLDITERKKTEESLEKDQQELNRIIDSSPIIIFYKDNEGKFIRVNEAFAKAQKTPKEKFLGKTVFDFYSAEIAQSMTNDDLEVLKSEHPRLGIIEQYESAKGIRWVQTDKVPTFDKDGIVTGLVGFAQDITERRKAEDALQESESKFRMYVENSPVSVFVADSEGKYLYVNAAASKLLGYSAKELTRMGIPQIVFNEDLAAILNDFTALQETGQILEELRLKNRYGQAVYVSLNAVKLPDGKLIAFCENVTGRKKAEESLNRLMDQLVRVNEKLGVVGGLTRHDVRNKLSAVTGYAYLLKKKHSDQADIIEALGKMEQAVAESVRIFDFAKMYEQLGVEELTYINLGKTLDEALALFSGSLNVKVIKDCHELTLLADTFLRQLFFNLIDNSVKHGEKATTIKVSFEKTDQDRLNLIYEDNGIGISADNKSNLFKSGFSTGSSSGYGLYLIRKMMEIYGWTIQENGEPDKGAKFTITIPRINQNGKENFRIAPCKDT